MEFKDKLQFYMKKNNMKQADLSHLTNIPSSLISWYVAGRKTPSLKNIIPIANALDVSLDELTGRDEQSVVLTPHEKSLIQKYRKLDIRGQETINKSIDIQCELMDMKPGKT